MKIVLLLVATFLILGCQSSPIQIAESPELVEQGRGLSLKGRQSAAGAVAAASSDDDDDDDDDDEEDIEDALVGDDDDDDDEEEAGNAVPTDDDDDDDDEGDYLERIFDDILEDDDDDDDDDVSPSLVVEQAPAAPAQQPAAAVSDAVNEVDSPAGLSADYSSDNEQPVFYDEENGNIDTKVDLPAPNKAQDDQAQKVPVGQQQLTNEVSDTSEDDDDDEEDEIEGALVGDDDDDDDDDDDEDDLIGEDVIEARARSLEEENEVPEILTSRYNQFVDGIFGRINKILKQSYDPVHVQMTVNKQNGKTKSAPKKKKSQKNVQAGRTKVEDIENKAIDIDIKEEGVKEKRSMDDIPVGIPEKFITTSSSHGQESTPELRANRPVQKKRVPSTAATKTKPSQTPAKNGLPVKSQNTKAPPKLKQNTPASKPTPSANANKVKTVRRAEGTLYGLASLKRVGNVKVIPEGGNNSTVKSKFTLGPLTLKVEKSFKRGTTRSVKSATAKTNEMIGRINLRVVNGAATLVSIKVQQPKQVQVESVDNHDRTREFVWKRSSHIAHLVSEKLSAAALSSLRPVGGTIVTKF